MRFSIVLLFGLIFVASGFAVRLGERIPLRAPLELIFTNQGQQTYKANIFDSDDSRGCSGSTLRDEFEVKPQGTVKESLPGLPKMIDYCIAIEAVSGPLVFGPAQKDLSFDTYANNKNIIRVQRARLRQHKCQEENQIPSLEIAVTEANVLSVKWGEVQQTPFCQQQKEVELKRKEAEENRRKAAEDQKRIQEEEDIKARHKAERQRAVAPLKFKFVFFVDKKAVLTVNHKINGKCTDNKIPMKMGDQRIDKLEIGPTVSKNAIIKIVSIEQQDLPEDGTVCLKAQQGSWGSRQSTTQEVNARACQGKGLDHDHQYNTFQVEAIDRTDNNKKLRKIEIYPPSCSQ